MKIYWSEEAIEQFEQIIKFLLENWSQKEVRKFKNTTLSVIQMIVHNPRAGKWSQKMNCSIFVIHRKVSILYDLSRKGDLMILSFWNNLSGIDLFD